MPGNSTSSTFIACSSVSDASRLASILSSPAAWTGQTAPDLVFPNNGQVELYWTVSDVAASAPVAAVAAIRATVAPAATVTHRNSHGTSSSKLS